MGIVEVILFAAVLSLAGTGWRLHRYPGGWRFAFSGSHDNDREDLNRARRTARELQDGARRELAAAQGQVARADRSHRRRVSEAKRRLRRLRRSGNGAFASALGNVSLHQHAIVISRPQRKVLPLGGMEVKFEHSSVGNLIYLRLPNAVHLESYAVGKHSEDSVRRFSVRIENAVAKENRYLTELTASIKKAEDELTAAQADTRPAREARLRLGVVTARQSRNRALDEALARLEAARDRWQALTGRRPPC
ncbi:hypothetical protein [Streptomyces sp. NPDC001070]